ncbi:MAG: potassium transporter TrkG, partial [Rhizobiaceae bacterium]
MLAVLFYLACVGLTLTISLVGPILIGIAVGEQAVAMRFSVYLLLGGFLFGAVALAILHRQRRMPRIGRLSLVALVWFILPIVAAIPIMDVSQLDLTDSLFESVSGVTTTGSSVIQSVESWPVALIFWRVQLQWLGGFLSILTVVLFLAPLGIGGLTGRTRTLVANVDQSQALARMLFLTSRFALVYLLMTLLCFI